MGIYLRAKKFQLHSKLFFFKINLIYDQSENRTDDEEENRGKKCESKGILIIGQYWKPCLEHKQFQKIKGKNYNSKKYQIKPPMSSVKKLWIQKESIAIE